MKDNKDPIAEKIVEMEAEYLAKRERENGLYQKLEDCIEFLLFPAQETFGQDALTFCTRIRQLNVIESRSTKAITFTFSIPLLLTLANML